jgi:hypothetical protein
MNPRRERGTYKRSFQRENEVMMTKKSSKKLGNFSFGKELS